MTQLTLAIRNLLAQDEDLKALLGKSASWDTWIFSEEMIGVKVENTSRCLIVVAEEDTWTSPNEHNTMRFPQVFVDIWADPTRNADKSVRTLDAKDKIEAIQPLIDRHLHLVDGGTTEGLPRVWGTAEEIATKTGIVVTGSQRLTGPRFSPIRDSEGSWMGRYTYGINRP